MAQYEYQVVPAPRRGERGKGLKTAEARFANALTRVMNRMAADDWEYLRTDTLPLEERSGLTGRTTTFQHLMIFRRPITTPTSGAATAAPPPPSIASETPASAAPAADPLDLAARRAALAAQPPPSATSPRVGPARPAAATTDANGGPTIDPPTSAPVTTNATPDKPPAS